jgi:hypothetical protein
VEYINETKVTGEIIYKKSGIFTDGNSWTFLTLRIKAKTQGHHFFFPRIIIKKWKDQVNAEVKDFVEVSGWLSTNFDSRTNNWQTFVQADTITKLLLGYKEKLDLEELFNQNEDYREYDEYPLSLEETF